MSSSVETATTDTLQGASPEQQIRATCANLGNKRADYVTCYDTLFGQEGLVSRLFPHPQARKAFLESPTGREMQQGLQNMLEDKEKQRGESKPISVMTPRMPLSFRSRIKSAAHKRETSMNKLWAGKLLNTLMAKGTNEVAEDLSDGPVVQPVDENDPTKVVTVRVPLRIHEDLLREAHNREISLNRLLISEILSLVEMIEADHEQGSQEATEAEAGEQTNADERWKMVA